MEGNGKEKGTPTLPIAAAPRLNWDEVEKLSDLESWKTWIAYKRDRRDRPYTAAGAAEQIKTFEQWGEMRAGNAVKYSMRNNWQGIFEDKAGSNGRESAQQVRERQRATQYESEIIIPILDPMEEPQ